MKIEIEDIKKINLSPGETLVVQVDCGNMPPNRRNEHLQKIANSWKQIFPDPLINIVTISTDVSLAIIGANVITNIGNTSPDPTTDYDRAMGIIK